MGVWMYRRRQQARDRKEEVGRQHWQCGFSIRLKDYVNLEEGVRDIRVEKGNSFS